MMNKEQFDALMDYMDRMVYSNAESQSHSVMDAARMMRQAEELQMARRDLETKLVTKKAKKT